MADAPRLRILVLSNLYPPAVIGGYEIECDTVVTHLRERHEVLVLTSNMDRSKAGHERGVARTLPFLPHRRVTNLLAPLHSLRAARATRRALREFRPDVAYVWNGAMIPQVAIRIVQSAGVPVLFRVCEHWFGSLYDDEPFMAGLRGRGTGAAAMKALDRLPELRVEARAALPAAISWNSEALRRMTPVPDTVAPTIERVTLPATLQGERFIGLERRPSEEITIGFIGRVAAYKGADVAVRATALLAEKHGVRARLLIAGNGLDDFLAELRGLATELGIGDRVELVGPLDAAGLATSSPPCTRWSSPRSGRSPPAWSRSRRRSPGCRWSPRRSAASRRSSATTARRSSARPATPTPSPPHWPSTFADPAATAVRVERAFERAQSLRVGPYLESMDRFLAEALEAAPK